jgi:hypothetical protein
LDQRFIHVNDSGDFSNYLTHIGFFGKTCLLFIPLGLELDLINLDSTPQSVLFYFLKF